MASNERQFEVDPEHRHGVLYEAAIEAEVETGRAETSEEQARASVIRRMARISAGFGLLLLAGAVGWLPGPGGIFIAFLGLTVLAQDFVWAERMVRIVTNRMPKDEDGNIPRKVWVKVWTTVAICVAASTSVAIWWTQYR